MMPGMLWEKRTRWRQNPPSQGQMNTLDLILDDIRDFDSGLADTLPQRLDLIRTNIDRDVETAIEDCNQLIEDLLAVEAALYP